ncbi:MAG: ribosomal protein S6--L-glutamate ligase [Pseudomonadota bacterium]
MEKFTIGWEEWAALPKLGLPAIKVKTDTGAKTSALHAENIQLKGTRLNPKVSFEVSPDPDLPNIRILCHAKVIDQREVVSSNGISELRYVIETPISIGNKKWDIEITLSNRSSMTYRMILGRSALEKVTVRPDKGFIHDKISLDIYNKLPKNKPVVGRLKIAVLTRGPDNYSVKRFIEEARRNNHQIDIVDTKRCYLNINSASPEVHYDGEALPHYDAIIPRIGPSITFYGMAVVRQFQAMGTFCLNSAEAIGASRDKLAAHQILVRHKIPMPNTAFASSPKDTSNLIELTGGAPIILKLLESSQGRGVVLAESQKAASAVIGAFRGLDANFITQEFIKEAGGSDIRCLVIGRKVVAAMMRSAQPGEFRSNLHAGGTAKKVEATKEEKDIAIKAARTLGLNVAGVDIIRTDQGPKVLEVNSSPGLEGIEKTTAVNVAQNIIKLIEQNVRSLQSIKK